MPLKITLVTLLLFLIGCQSADSNKNGLDELEVQEEVQRFYTRFTERIITVFLSELEAKEPKQQFLIRRQYLLYDSEALKIATGPYPELNLLDMLVFVKINHAIVKKFWAPKLFQDKSTPVLKAFKNNEMDIDHVALKVINQDQLNAINQFVIQWLKANPNQFRVEKIRMGDFEEVLGPLTLLGKGGRKRSITNFIVDIKGTVEAVDQVLLASNRAIFLAQQMPFLLRLQARIGAVEVTSDLVEQSEIYTSTFSPMMKDVDSITAQLLEMVTETRLLLKEFREAFPQKKSRGDIQAEERPPIQTIDSIMGTTLDVLELMSSQKVDPVKLQKLKTELKEFAFYILGFFLILTIIVSTVWWGCYYLAKKRLKRIGPV